MAQHQGEKTTIALCGSDAGLGEKGDFLGYLCERVPSPGSHSTRLSPTDKHAVPNAGSTGGDRRRLSLT